MRRWIVGLAAAAAALYAAPLAYLYAFQRAYVFRPSQERIAPAEAGLKAAESHEIVTADGERIVAWYVPPRPGAPLVLSFHGQTGTVARVAERLRAFADAGFGVLGVSYRGYGGSTGVPTEEGLHRDAEAALAWLRARGGDTRRLVVHGFSLGAAVAVRLASGNPVDGLILEAPFASAVDVAAIRYPVFPVRWLMHDPFRSDLAIADVKAPLLVLHGSADRTVPLEQGRKLYDLAQAPKRFVTYPEGGHNDLPRHGAVDEMIRFVRDVAGVPQALAE